MREKRTQERARERGKEENRCSLGDGSNEEIVVLKHRKIIDEGAMNRAEQLYRNGSISDSIDRIAVLSTSMIAQAAASYAFMSCM